MMTPMTVERRATPNATFSEICPPCSTRESMSRPRTSVPNQWALDGGNGGCCVANRSAIWLGSCAKCTPTKHARSVTTRNPRPAIAIVWCRNRRHATRHSPPSCGVPTGCGGRSVGSMPSARARPDSSPTRMLIEEASRSAPHVVGDLPAPVRTADPDAGVERGVEDVGEEVEEHHEDGGHRHPRQDHGVIESLERVEEQ